LAQNRKQGDTMTANGQTTVSKHNYLYGALMCLFATVSWGGMFPIMGTALHHTNAFMFTLIRYTAAAGIFALLLRRKEGVAAFSAESKWLLVWVLGSLGFAGFGFCVFLGQSLSGSSGALSASVMMALMPMLSIIINWGLRGIKARGASVFFVVLSFSGVLTVVTKGDYASLANLGNHVIADGLILLGATCWVVYTIGASYFANWSPVRYTALTTLYSVPTIWAINLVLSLLGNNPVPGLSDLIAILPEITYMVFVAGFLGVLAWNSGNRRITSLNGVLFMDVVPLTTFAISALLGYEFSAAELVGATITISALILNNFYQRAVLRRAAARMAPTSIATPHQRWSPIEHDHQVKRIC
jgi:drug/metabolite transporter (DMT)-like permease